MTQVSSIFRFSFLTKALEGRRSANAAATQVTLQKDQLWSFHARPGATLRCECGAPWLTQSGDSRDILLSAGETRTITRRGKVVITALQPAAFRIAR